MNKPNRCQVSVELMVVTSVLITIFIIVGFMIYRNYVKTQDLKLHVFGNRLAKNIASQINALNVVGDGHATRMSLPERLLGGGNYTVNFYPGESSVFVEGGGFSWGPELKFSSPISTERVVCLLQQCKGQCNTTTENQCLQVNGTLDVRLVRYDGTVYITPLYNVMQDDVAAYVEAYDGPGNISVDDIQEFVKDAGVPWDVMFVYHNRLNGTYNLVFSLNITNNEMAEMRVGDIVGEVISVQSREAGEPPEFNLDGDPQAQWNGDAVGKVTGGVLEFKRGFSLCVTPQERMPSQTWVFLSSDGRHVTLDKGSGRKVCITYP